MGKIDIPAMLSFVKNEKGWAGKIPYLGHSMGTTAMFYLQATDFETIKS